MGQAGEKYVADSGFKPMIKFSDKEEHTFQFVSEKIDDIDFDGTGDKSYMRYSVIEASVEKDIVTSSVKFVEQMNKAKEGDMVTAQMVTKSINGRMVNAYNITIGENVAITKPKEEAPLSEKAEDEIDVSDIPF